MTPSFPTRRSSDLIAELDVEQLRDIVARLEAACVIRAKALPRLAGQRAADGQRIAVRQQAAKAQVRGARRRIIGDRTDRDIAVRVALDRKSTRLNSSH